MTEHSAPYKILVILFLVLAWRPMAGQVYPVKEIDSLLSEGVHNLILQDYPDAYRNFSTLDVFYPDLPLGKIFLAGTSMSESYDLGTQFKADYIDSLLESALAISETLLENEDANPWNYYFAGLSFGFQGYNNALNENFIDAFFNGYNSLTYFEECLMLDNKFFEAKIPIGTYLYWKAEKSLDLSWLPFFPDQKKEGIDLLASAADSANYLKYFADYSLMWIYYNEQEYEKAAQIAEKFLSEYPDSRLFKLGLAKAMRFIDKKKAIEIFRNLIESYRALRQNNHLQEILMLKMVAELYYETGEYSKALETCDETLLFNDLEPFVKEASSERLKAMTEIRQKAKDLLTDN